MSSPLPSVALLSSVNAESSNDSPEDAAEQEEQQDADLPLTIAASVVLTTLPKDAHEALEAISKEGDGEKVKIRVIPMGAAPQLRQNRFTLSASKRFETIIKQLRRRVGIKESESIFCYVHQTFSPAPDEGIGNLHRCYKINDELVVHYAITPAYG